MKGLALISSVFFLTSTVNSQILIGEPETKTETKDDKKAEKMKSDSLKKTELDGSTAAYFVANWSSTFRLLKPNGDVYGDSLGTRANEGKLNIWSFGVGIQNKLNDYFMWDGGIYLLKNGESYLYTEKDTSYSYNTSYHYIGMPIRINFTYGNQFKLYAGAGLLPQMFTGYQQARKWTTADNHKEEETFSTKSGYNTFVISAIFNVGFMLSLQNNWSILVSPEARIQLNSSYPKLDGYIHKGRAFGVTFGLVRDL